MRFPNFQMDIIAGKRMVELYRVLDYTVDAERSIVEQHRQIRGLFRDGAKRPWSDWNADAVADWLAIGGGAA
jgi:hypothetical protein